MIHTYLDTNPETFLPLSRLSTSVIRSSKKSVSFLWKISNFNEEKKLS